MNKNPIRGRAKEAKGKVQEVNSKILDDEPFEAEGNIRKNFGNVQVGVAIVAQRNTRKNFGNVQVGIGGLKKDIRQGR